MDINIIDPRDYGVDFYGDNLFTTEQELRGHPERVVSLRRATLKGWRYALENPDEIIDLILEKYNSRNQSRTHLKYQAHETAKMIVPKFVELGRFETTRFKKIAETYAQLGAAQSTEIHPDFFYHSAKWLSTLTETEKAWLQASPTIRIATNAAWPPMDFLDDSGEPKGIGADFIGVLNKRLGNKLVVVPGSWEEIYNQVKEGSIDALMDITPRPDRQQYFNFTEPYITVPHIIFAQKGSPYNSHIEDLEGKTVGVEREFYIIDFLKASYPGITVKEFKTTANAIDALAKGSVDAYIGNRAVAMHIIENELISNIEPQGTVDATRSINAIGVRKDLPNLRDILQKGLDDISLAERSAILQKWTHSTDFDGTDKHSQLSLTEEERLWLEKHPIIKVVLDPDWAPVGIPG